MDNVILQVWNTLKINAPLLSETKCRIKELFLMLVILQAGGEEICVMDKLEEINKLSQREELLNWFYDNFVCQRQLVTENEDQRKIAISSETSAKFLMLIEQYQTATNPWQETNFGAQIYIENYLSQKIDLLHQIGILAHILADDETFDSSTRVTQKTQDVCNLVCDWVEANLALSMERLNVYEPFIYRYKKFVYLRSDILKEIGTRSGLLPETIGNSENEISENDTKAVIDWLDDNYGVKLMPPDNYHRELVDNLKINYKQLFVKTALVVVPLISLLPIGISFYDHLQQRPSPDLSKILLKRNLEMEKSLRHKPTR